MFVYYFLCSIWVSFENYLIKINSQSSHTASVSLQPIKCNTYEVKISSNYDWYPGISLDHIIYPKTLVITIIILMWSRNFGMTQTKDSYYDLEETLIVLNKVHIYNLIAIRNSFTCTSIVSVRLVNLVSPVLYFGKHFSPHSNTSEFW